MIECTEVIYGAIILSLILCVDCLDGDVQY